ncbi:T9SS C-terminal target domain-containing protein [Aquimarina sp. AD1]|uniref:endonuclease n=1 Tax=Aquimarina sp. (strain AD1) TaxID=1714848 RepID=UPI000E501AA0|nr:endonuclease [Aquimarina sp. AD1]AXT55783.1 T9SS C-terminal target domain-containing protein [Aquimarina sp. AD1]RKN31363.1 T9SS C-terminal target domain-containing protein [Aquimarina sp. AD1]
MKKIVLLLVMGYSLASFGQIPSYYNDVNLSLSGQSLKNELATKVTNTQTNTLSYTPGVWDALKQTDLDPTNSSRVILIYGYNDTDGNTTTDRTRGVDNNGGGSTDWNREHVYPKSLGNPNLGTSGPGADAHHLRPSDVQRNSSRGSRKFADGSGNSGPTSQGHWYPGDEFKGDVARMMMFMYIRYGNRCLPSNVGIGTAVSGDSDMIELFLEWNAEDPVSTLELQRNPIIENLQGNRNPFIDNPAFATQIWGGPQAEDRFGSTGGGGNTLCSSTVTTFPYNEGFENTFGAWKQATSGDDFNWATRSGSTPSSNTGPSSANAGSYYIYMESSSPNYSNKRAILYSPCYDITSATQATISFKYHMYGASAMGSLALEASLDGTSWTSIWSKSGNQGNSWETASVNLAAYLGEKVQLRFNGITGTTWQGDMAIDAVSISTSGSTGGGSTTSDVNLRITFDQYPEETSWEIRNESNQLVFSGGTYGSQTDGSTINLSRTLDVGCYTLVVKDSYGDGICCSYGNGSYELTDTSGSVLVSGGSFGSQDTKSFCVTSTSRVGIDTIEEKVEKSNVFDFSFYPNPVKGNLNLQLNDAVEANYQIVNYVGQIMKKGELTAESIQLNGLSSGMYFIIIDTGEQKVSKKFTKE